MEEARQEEWAEKLPENCPPADAWPPVNQVFYRLVERYPPSDKDFYSQRRLNPDKPFRDECLARAVSVFACLRECASLRQLRRHSQKIIVRLTPPADSGVIKRTFRSRGHYSWWLKKNYNPTRDSTFIPDEEQ